MSETRLTWFKWLVLLCCAWDLGMAQGLAPFLGHSASSPSFASAILVQACRDGLGFAPFLGLLADNKLDLGN